MPSYQSVGTSNDSLEDSLESLESLGRFNVERFQNAISNLKKEERNVNGQKNYFKNLSAKDQFRFINGLRRAIPCSQNRDILDTSRTS